MTDRRRPTHFKPSKRRLKGGWTGYYHQGDLDAYYTKVLKNSRFTIERKRKGGRYRVYKNGRELGFATNLKEAKEIATEKYP